MYHQMFRNPRREATQEVLEQCKKAVKRSGLDQKGASVRSGVVLLFED